MTPALLDAVSEATPAYVHTTAHASQSLTSKAGTASIMMQIEQIVLSLLTAVWHTNRNTFPPTPSRPSKALCDDDSDELKNVNGKVTVTNIIASSFPNDKTTDGNLLSWQYRLKAWGHKRLLSPGPMATQHTMQI